MAERFKKKIDRLAQQYTEGAILECKKCFGASFDVQGNINFRLNHTKPLVPEILVTDFVTKNLVCISCNESIEPIDDMVRDDLLFVTLCRVFGHKSLEEIRKKLDEL